LFTLTTRGVLTMYPATRLVAVLTVASGPALTV